jgi:hypothetical protein
VVLPAPKSPLSKTTSDGTKRGAIIAPSFLVCSFELDVKVNFMPDTSERKNYMLFFGVLKKKANSNYLFFG